MMMKVSAENILKEVKYLTETIGVRLAGSEQERQAADYLRSRFLQYIPKCTIEEFPVMERCAEQEELRIYRNHEWVSFPCSLFNAAPTTGGRPLDAELVFFDSHTDYKRPDISFLKGKGVIHYGVHIRSEDDYRRLMEAQPAFLLMVDTRYTNECPLADGLFPAYVRKYGAVPTVNVAFFDVWKWCTQKAERAILTVSGETRKSMSQNVIAELPGTEAEPLYICTGSHHDTQAGTPGADDNAIGCAILLELARVLSAQPHRHTLRFISFGSEEMLSVGSASYVRTHRQELSESGRFMCNFDSCGSAVGWNYFVTNACDALRGRMEAVYHAKSVYYQESTVPDPCNDLFPFTAAGVPGLTLMRGNCESGIFYHHRFDNTADKISPEVAAHLADASAELIAELADVPDLSALSSVAQNRKEAVATLWNMTYGGWNPSELD